MSTAVISGRIDEDIKRRADAYIRAAGLNAGNIIKAVWENIAETGELPRAAACETRGAESAFERFMALRETIPSPRPGTERMASLTPRELKGHLAEQRLKDYLDL